MIGEIPTPQTAAQSDPGLFDKWRGWLSNPQNRTALLQTGLSLMQAPQPGQNRIAHIGGAIGQGLAAAGRSEARTTAEARQQAKLDRELESETLDREIKRSGVELDRLNTESLIGSRKSSTANEAAGLGIRQKESEAGLEKTKAEIANLQGKGGITLSDMFKASKDVAEIAELSGKPVADVTRTYLEAQSELQKGLSGVGGTGNTAIAGSTSQYPQPKSAAEAAMLPSGTIFMAPDGSLRRQP